MRRALRLQVVGEANAGEEPAEIGPRRRAAKAAAIPLATFQRRYTRSPQYVLPRVCVAAGLPEPEAEVRFHPSRRWRFDFAWPMDRIALEIDGGLWVNGRHSRGSGRLKDMEKFNEAAIRGWRVLYVTPDQVRDGTAAGLLLRILRAKEVA